MDYVNIENNSINGSQKEIDANQKTFDIIHQIDEKPLFSEKGEDSPIYELSLRSTI